MREVYPVIAHVAASDSTVRNHRSCPSPDAMLTAGFLRKHSARWMKIRLPGIGSQSVGQKRQLILT
jgi:hypothetical protein